MKLLSIFLYLTLFSTHCYAFNSTNNIAPGKSYIKTPLGLNLKTFTNIYTDTYKSIEKPVDLHLSIGLERRFHSKSLGQTIMFGTNVLIPMYDQLGELSDLYSLPGEFSNKVFSPNIIELGVNFKLFF